MKARRSRNNPFVSPARFVSRHPRGQKQPLGFFREENAAHCLVSRRVVASLLACGIVKPTPVTNLFPLAQTVNDSTCSKLSFHSRIRSYFRASPLLEYNRIRHDSLANAIHLQRRGFEGSTIEKGLFRRGGSCQLFLVWSLSRLCVCSTSKGLRQQRVKRRSSLSTCGN